MTNERYWGYCGDDSADGNQFIMFANWNKSSSIRRFDAETGLALGREAGSHPDFREAFRSLYMKCAEVEPPYNVNMEGRCRLALPDDIFQSLKSQIKGGKRTRAEIGEPKPAGSKSILAGVDAIIDHALGVTHIGSAPHHIHKTSCALLSQTPVRFDGYELIRAIFSRIESNWDNSKCRSNAIWRWTAMLDIAEKNESIEKTLEKAIVRNCPEWVNQIPTAAGLQRGYEEKHRNIDLARKVPPDGVEFIELKIGANADTPLRAAFEILVYGMLWAFCVLNAEDLGFASKPASPLAMKRVELKVLAPAECYTGYQLGWLELILNIGLKQFAAEWLSGREMNFVFERFPDSFRWPDASGSELEHALANRVRLYAVGDLK